MAETGQLEGQGSSLPAMLSGNVVEEKARAEDLSLPLQIIHVVIEAMRAETLCSAPTN
jgi:hypothetical protein